jgi:hypothetical protein
MTLALGTGLLNALDSVHYLLSRSLPSKVAARNAAEYPQIICPLAGSYYLPAGAGAGSIVLSYNGGAANTYSYDLEAPMSLTAADLATSLNALGEGPAGFGTLWRATTALGGRHLVIKSKTAGAGSIVVGAGTINSIVGINEGRQYNVQALRNPAYYRKAPQGENEYPGYPAIHLWGSESIEPEGGGDIITYTLTCRIYEVAPQLTGDSTDALYRAVLELADCVVDTVYDITSADLGSTVEAARVLSVQPSDAFEENTSEAVDRLYCDVTIELKVQEDL